MQEQTENSSKASVRIKLDSTADGEKLSRELNGEWYYRNNGIYVRYTESEEGHSVRTLVSWKDGVLKVARRGDAESDQTFALGKRLPGYYANSQVRLNLDTETTLLRVVSDTIPGKAEGAPPQPSLPLVLEWHYSLWAADEQAGNFIVRLHAERREDDAEDER
ncbi:DUF1934 domain-containing protein [Cohnella panacarvi]|uniref:DUF1934 domain-containing protein n=1 Tax=Cohnella panacarvi TaxID=400776 RepID=UPI00047C4BC2|nr:DUF1934 domain-containing protein [Cohnella panacarvi]